MESVLGALFSAESVSKDNIKTDSRDIKKGDIFVAIKGTTHDGHDYIPEVIAKGVSRVLCEHSTADLSEKDREKIIVVSDAREALGRIARHVYKDPTKGMNVYGVTGTNGKTTTVFLIDSILNHVGRHSGLVSTVFTKSSGDVLERASMTTPGLLFLNRLLSDMIASGKNNAVVEISSHALDQQRVWGIELDAAVFTNITPEHLDYHGSMKKYLEDKSKIFSQLKPGGSAVLNVDDPLVGGLKGKLDLSNLVTFGLGEDAEVRGENINLLSEGVEFDLTVGEIGQAHVRSRLIGTHNVYNMLAAIAALFYSGLSVDQMASGLENASPVPGRLDIVPSRAPFRVFVDYAHTPNALANVLYCLRPLTDKRLICVFGCGGDRDKTKRPVMGQIAAEASDFVFATSDNPRSENPEDILSEIEKGMSGKTNYSIITNREDAIRKALEAAKEGDIVIVAGKGHEDYQIIGDEQIHFDDKEVAGNILKELGY